MKKEYLGWIVKVVGQYFTNVRAADPDSNPYSEHQRMAYRFASKQEAEAAFYVRVKQSCAYADMADYVRLYRMVPK